jgi:hypothetical protein
MTQTMQATQTLYASFADTSLAERAAGALLDHGVRPDGISLVSKAVYEAMVEDPADNRKDPEFAAKTGLSVTTPGDAVAGAAKGAGIGLGVGALAAISSIAIPGFGIVLGGGALAAAIAGAAGATAAGAVAGGVHGYLKDQGVSEDAVANLSSDYYAGGAILAVTARPEEIDHDTAERILTKYQGNHISTFGTFSD